MARRVAAKYRPRRFIVLGAVATVAALGFIGIWGVGHVAEDSADDPVGGAGIGADSNVDPARSPESQDAGSSVEPERSPEPVEAPAAEPIRLDVSVSGDILIHSPLYRRALANGGDKYDFRPMFRQIEPVVRGADLSICHLETPLTDGEPTSFPIFATPAPLADAIAATGWDACTTASNHSVDGGLAGIRATSRALNRAGLAHTGSAATRRQSRHPLLLKARGTTVALLSYTTFTNGIPLPEPWAVNLAAPERILADARRARRAGAEAVVVNIHWGDEDSSQINAEQLGVAKALTKARAVTALVGQGPHVVQPIRRVNGSRVVFSEGNLLSNQTPACCASGSQDGLIALLRIVIDESGDRLKRVRYVPTWVRHPDFAVLPVGSAARRGEADLAVLRGSYERTVAVAGRSGSVEPVPKRAP